jgi:hypothetical protein
LPNKAIVYDMATLEEHRKLIKEIKGVQRIVINCEHGGFGLSNEAVLRYLELCGIPVWNETKQTLGTYDFEYWLVPPGNERLDNIDTDKWASMSQSDRVAYNLKYSQQTFDPSSISRDDPYLVQVVLELGERASGKYASLKVVEIPGDVDWNIEEYDGKEWVAETHRTWH